MNRLRHLLVALLVFTVIVRYERPGAIYGELRMCFDAKTPAAAAAMARRVARRELQPGLRWRGITVRDDRCYWMPSDDPGEWTF